MAICANTTDEGFLIVNENPLSECQTVVLMTADEFNQTQVKIDINQASSIFFFAFGLVLFSYKSAFIIGTINSLIKRAR